MKKKLLIEALRSDSLKRVIEDLMKNEDLELRGWVSRKLESIFMPFIDVYEENNYFVVVADVGGFDKNELEIEVFDGKQKIHVSGKREKKDIEYAEDGRCREFSKDIHLPQKIKGKGEASLENGVLEIRVEKEEVETESIEVK